jgi:four helix bundle protein
MAWCRRTSPLRGSREKCAAGNTYCQPHSRSAAGYFWLKAYGKYTRPLPSATSKLAEGCSRSSRADYARFVEIATGSLFEVVSQATIGRNQGFLNQSDYQQVYDAAEMQIRMLSGLRKSLEVR